MAGKTEREIRRGLIKVRIRTRCSKNTQHYTLSVARLYRNGGEWKQSSRFSRDDISVTSTCARRSVYLDSNRGKRAVEGSMKSYDTERPPQSPAEQAVGPPRPNVVRDLHGLIDVGYGRRMRKRKGDRATPQDAIPNHTNH